MKLEITLFMISHTSQKFLKRILKKLRNFLAMSLNLVKISQGEVKLSFKDLVLPDGPLMLTYLVFPSQSIASQL